MSTLGTPLSRCARPASYRVGDTVRWLVDGRRQYEGVIVEVHRYTYTITCTYRGRPSRVYVYKSRVFKTPAA